MVDDYSIHDNLIEDNLISVVEMTKRQYDNEQILAEKTQKSDISLMTMNDLFLGLKKEYIFDVTTKAKQAKIPPNEHFVGKGRKKMSLQFT